LLVRFLNFGKNKIMETKIINNNSELLLVSDGDIKVGDWFFDTISNTIHHAELAIGIFNTRKKILASEKSTPIGLIIPQHILDEIKGVDIEQKSRLYSEQFSTMKFHEMIGIQQDYKNGYNQALQDNKEKRYTEEDLINFGQQLCSKGLWYSDTNKEWNETFSRSYEPNNALDKINLIIQSIQPKEQNEWKVEIEMEGIYKISDSTGVNKDIYYPKIILNQDGKECLTIKKLL